jgi:hypothetical protein
MYGHPVLVVVWARSLERIERRAMAQRLLRRVAVAVCCVLVAGAICYVGPAAAMFDPLSAPHVIGVPMPAPPPPLWPRVVEFVCGALCGGFLLRLLGWRRP